MSHFTVLCIGDDVDEQLAPFNEQPEEDDEACAPFLSWKAYGKNAEYYADTKEQAEKECIDAGDTLEEGPYFHNTQAQWDWYVIGGRWTGFFKLKEGASGKLGERGIMTDKAASGKADQAYKRDIDFEGMFKAAGEHALKIYDKAMEIFGEAPVNESWREMLNRLQALGKPIEDIRDEYHKQPRCKALALHAKENEDSPFRSSGYDADNFLCTKEQFIKRAQINTVSTYAILKDGEWIEKGEMGWFGMSTDLMSEDEWNDKFMKMLDDLPDDTLLTVVDCHI